MYRTPLLLPHGISYSCCDFAFGEARKERVKTPIFEKQKMLIMTIFQDLQNLQNYQICSLK